VLGFNFGLRGHFHHRHRATLPVVAKDNSPPGRLVIWRAKLPPQSGMQCSPDRLSSFSRMAAPIGRIPTRAHAIASQTVLH
jgi:hypothetical protein